METYKVLKSVGSQVEVSHKRKEPDDGVRTSLSETVPDTGISLLLDSVGRDASVGELSFLRGQPFCCQWGVRETEEADYGNDKCDYTLEDEQPLPSGQTCRAVHTVEYTSGNETCKGSGENVTSVEDSDTCGNLLAVVEDTEEVNSARIVRCFCHTKEAVFFVSHDYRSRQGGLLQANQQKTDKVVADGGQS